MVSEKLNTADKRLEDVHWLAGLCMTGAMGILSNCIHGYPILVIMPFASSNIIVRGKIYPKI